MPKTYDTIIIGAGIAGASLAYALTKQNQNVLVLDKNGIASGGSGAAGAFVSPKIGLASPLHTLTNEAFEYAKDFYLKHCPEYYAQTGVLRIPKDDADDKKFPMYEEANSNVYKLYESERLKAMGIDVPYDGFFFPDAGACEALDICEFLLQDIEVEISNVDKIIYKDGIWSVLRQAQEPMRNTVTKSVTELAEVRAKNIVIATGFENNLFNMDYMGIHGVWGNRGDFSTSLDLPIRGKESRDPALIPQYIFINSKSEVSMSPDAISFRLSTCTSSHGFTSCTERSCVAPSFMMPSTFALTDIDWCILMDKSKVLLKSPLFPHTPCTPM